MKKRSYLYEIPIFYFFLILLNYIFLPEVLGFTDISPHPYWLGILLFGFRYGVFAGVACGILSSILYLAFNWFFGERYIFEDVGFYMLPTLFIVVGALVGFGVNRYLGRLKVQKKRIEELGKIRTELMQELNVQKTITTNLEKRIVTKMATLVTLYKGARTLDTINITDLYDAILEFISRTLDVDFASLYLHSETGWKKYKTFGRSSENGAIGFYDFHHGLVGLAGSTEKITTIKDYLGAEEFKKKIATETTEFDCLMAGPLRQGETGPVVGIFAVHEMPLLSLTSATTNLFAFLLNWANRSIGKAHYFEELKAHEVLDPEYNIYSYTYFQSRFQQEFVRSKTYYLPLTVGLVRVKGLSDLSVDAKDAIYRAISQLLKESCRKTDIIARYPDSEISFVCLLTTTSEAQAKDIKQKIIENYEKLQLKGKLGFDLGLSSYTPQIKSTGSLIDLAIKDLDHAA